MKYPVYKVLIDIPHSTEEGDNYEWIETVESDTFLTKESAIRLYQNTIGSMSQYTFDDIVVRVVEYTGDSERVCCSAMF